MTDKHLNHQICHLKGTKHRKLDSVSSTHHEIDSLYHTIIHYTIQYKW